jgi:hypothetical protein
MRNFIALTIAGLLVLAVSATAIAHSDSGWGHMGNSGHMGYRGHMDTYDNSRNDQGWMHRGYDGGYGQGRGYCWNNQTADERVGVTSADQARAEVEEYLSTSRNPNLKTGEITEKENSFEVDIVTKDGSLADKWIVEKQTGRLYPAYR